MDIGISCKNHTVGCDFTAEIDSVLTHEEDCPYRSVRCVVLSCYRVMRFNDVEEHMAEHHQDMLTGEWVVHDQSKEGAPVLHDGVHYSMMTWNNAGTRFFATLFVSREVLGEKAGTEDFFWNIWVTAVCGKISAEKFRAEVRLSSSALPECSLIYNMPVNHFESNILERDLKVDGLSTCKASLRLHHEIVGKHMSPTSHLTSKLMVSGTDVPFKCLVHEKVLPCFDEGDIEDEEETGDTREKRNGEKE